MNYTYNHIQVTATPTRARKAGTISNARLNVATFVPTTTVTSSLGRALDVTLAGMARSVMLNVAPTARTRTAL